MNISRWMADKVILKKYKGQAGNGKKIYEQKAIKARIENKENITTTVAGVITSGKGRIFTQYKLINGDKITYNGIEYEVITVNEYKDKQGRVSHYEGVFR